GPRIQSVSPIDGSLLGQVSGAGEDEYERVLEAAAEAFLSWRAVPAPKRGEMIRALGDELRRHKDALGTLVSLEMGKIKAEGDGEVQEMIDICDFAVGLSRQLYGKTMHSERSGNRMYEQWHPLGIIGLITSFNFPVAVWAWNFAVSAAAGDVTVWKPSSKTPLCAVAVTRIAQGVLASFGFPGAVASLLVGGGAETGERMIRDPRIPLISATGSTSVGRRIGRVVGERLGRTLLELGGNNALIVAEQANLDLALQATLFGAVGTAGQRCTSTRRLFLHEAVYDRFLGSLREAYRRIRVGNPLDPRVLMGPLADPSAVADMQRAIRRLLDDGGRVLCGGEPLSGPGHPGGCYVRPCLAEAQNRFPIVQEETFAPVLYVMKFRSLDEAIAMQNDVPQGLSSSLFTERLSEAELFLSSRGSDCGIANINTGTSGAEIGGAFGGEKETGGGRESGSDSWKFYMRRQTNNINWSDELPLAQGVRFSV
ncbi:MAG TPA: aldehyde dehydrogenase family protein, partial [Candidatus Aminicenantes bacterium]|nr:aldehyde dehydrogenase family protein [Candidatus Aminicenantes bacterium]